MSTAGQNQAVWIDKTWQNTWSGWWFSCMCLCSTPETGWWSALTRILYNSVRWLNHQWLMAGILWYPVVAGSICLPSERNWFNIFLKINEQRWPSRTGMDGSPQGYPCVSSNMASCKSMKINERVNGKIVEWQWFTWVFSMSNYQSEYTKNEPELQLTSTNNRKHDEQKHCKLEYPVSDKSRWTIQKKWFGRLGPWTCPKYWVFEMLI